MNFKRDNKVVTSLNEQDIEDFVQTSDKKPQELVPEVKIHDKTTWKNEDINQLQDNLETTNTVVTLKKEELKKLIESKEQSLINDLFN